MEKSYVSLDAEEVEKVKMFAEATLKIYDAFEKMLDDERIDEKIRKEYRQYMTVF